MTQSSIREYAGAVRQRYFLASKKENGRIVDEFTKVTGHHRKTVIQWQCPERGMHTSYGTQP